MRQSPRLGFAGVECEGVRTEFIQQFPTESLYRDSLSGSGEASKRVRNPLGPPACGALAPRRLSRLSPFAAPITRPLCASTAAPTSGSPRARQPSYSPSPRRESHSTLSLAAIGCHSLGIHTLILL